MEHFYRIFVLLWKLKSEFFLHVDKILYIVIKGVLKLFEWEVTQRQRTKKLLLQTSVCTFKVCETPSCTVTPLWGECTQVCAHTDTQMEAGSNSFEGRAEIVLLPSCIVCLLLTPSHMSVCIQWACSGMCVCVCFFWKLSVTASSICCQTIWQHFALSTPRPLEPSALSLNSASWAFQDKPFNIPSVTPVDTNKMTS